MTSAKTYQARSITYLVLFLYMADQVIQAVAPELMKAYPTLKWLPALIAGVAALYRAAIYWKQSQEAPQA